MRFFLFLLSFELLLTSAIAQKIVVCGSKVLSEPINDAAEALRKSGVEIRIGSDSGSSAGITLLGEGAAQLAMSTRPLTAEDRSNYPEVTFTSVYLGEQAVAMCVSRDVWNSGVRALSRSQLQSIYEGKLKNWKDLGGIDQRIRFLTRPQGVGPWEVFAEWLYGDNRKAPLGRFPAYSEDMTLRKALQGSPGAIAPLTPLLADDQEVFALALAENDKSPPYAPTPSNIIAQKYRMSRPLYLIFDDKPTGYVKTTVEFMLSKQGQDILCRHGFLGRSAIEASIGRQLPLHFTAEK